MPEIPLPPTRRRFAMSPEGPFLEKIAFADQVRQKLQLLQIARDSGAALLSAWSGKSNESAAFANAAYNMVALDLERGLQLAELEPEDPEPPKQYQVTMEQLANAERSVELIAEQLATLEKAREQASKLPEEMQALLSVSAGMFGGMITRQLADAEEYRDRLREIFDRQQAENANPEGPAAEMPEPGAQA